MKFRYVILEIIKGISRVVYFWIQLRNIVWPDIKLRILNYHQICPENYSYPLVLAPWCVSSKSFSEQMKLLSDEGYNVLSIEETLKCLETRTPFPPKAVAITFDDGYQNNYIYALPILVQYGIKSTFYLTTGYIGKDKLFSWIKTVGSKDDLLFRKALNWQEIMEMGNLGMAFGSHSHTHPDFTKMDRPQINSELVESKRLLKERITSMENSFVVPFGVWGKVSVTVKELLQANGYTGATQGKFGAVTHKTDRFDLPRIFIYGEDSIQTFKQKIDGAYDWFGFIHKCYHSLRG